MWVFWYLPLLLKHQLTIFLSQVRKFVFKASFTESWPGAFDMIPLFKDTMEAELLECYSRCKVPQFFFLLHYPSHASQTKGDEKIIHSLKYSALEKCVTRFRPEKLEHPHMMCLLCLQRRADAQFQPWYSPSISKSSCFFWFISSQWLHSVLYPLYRSVSHAEDRQMS